MEPIIVITAVGQDRPGIVAALAKTVFMLGGNLDDATMTRLHGAFTMMLSAKLPTAVTVDDAAAALATVAEKLSLTITVQSVPDEIAPQADPDQILTVYGADHPGIVYQVAEGLAAHGVNITDLDTRLVGTANAQVYIMQIEAAVGEADLTDDLARLRRELGVEITAHPLDAEAL